MVANEDVEGEFSQSFKKTWRELIRPHLINTNKGIN